MITTFSFYIGKLFLMWLSGYASGILFSYIGNILRRSSGTF